MSIMALWSFVLILMGLKGCQSDDSSSSDDDNIPNDFGSTELELFRDEIRAKILANDDGLTFDSELVDELDLISSFDLVLIPAFVRLAFHDCAGSESGSPGNCDGCIDITNELNGGLYEGAMLPLQDICIDYNEEYDLSFADCWALAATFAIELGQERADSDWAAEVLNQFFEYVVDPPTQTIFSGDIGYFVGRKDNKKCGEYGVGDSSLNEDLPDPILGWQHGHEFMSEKFPELTYKEIVALISGGHSLGGGHGKISGFAGNWDTSKSLVDNEYHLELTMTTDRFGFFLNWQSGKINENFQSQFFARGPWAAFGLPQNDLFLMLNVDMELVYDLSYYIDNNLLDDIDCSANAIKYCGIYEPDSTVLYPGDDKEDGVSYCSLRQCPYKCNDDDTLNEYKNNGYSNVPDNADCPAAWMFQFTEDNENLGQTFAVAFRKMITQGYDADEDLKQLD